MELRDTKRVEIKEIKNIPKQISATTGWMAKVIPNNVATPFPPLKFAQIGKIWPMTAANPKRIIKLVLANSLDK